jgi:hypothetical protein
VTGCSDVTVAWMIAGPSPLNPESLGQRQPFQLDKPQRTTLMTTPITLATTTMDACTVSKCISHHAQAADHHVCLCTLQLG